MEQSLNILATILQVGQSGKGNADIAQALLQDADSPIKFGDLVVDASQINLLWAQETDVGVPLTPTDILEQEILALSTGLENQLAIAAQDNATPEAVNEILTQAVSQLWALLGEFDLQNGTQLSSNLAENLQQIGLEADTTLPAQTIVPQADGAEDAGKPPVLFVGESADQVTAPIFPISTPIDPSVSPAAPMVSQNRAPIIPPGSPYIQSGTPALPVLHPTIQGAISPMPAFQSSMEGENTPLFSQIVNLLNTPEPTVKNVQLQPNGVASGNLKLALNSEITPLTQNTPETVNLRSGPQSPNVSQIIAGQAITPLPTKMQQFEAAIPVKNLASTGNSAVDMTVAAGKIIPLASPLVAGIDVGAKVKELLLMSARNIVSGKETLASFGENAGGLSNSRTEFSVPLAPTKPEQASPPSGFSKNIANQIQEVTLNMGRTRIELAPRGLGSIVIELHPKDSGGLQVVLRAENPGVLQALRTDREVLLAVLSNSDVQQEDISLDFESFGQNGFTHSEQDGEFLDSNTELNEQEDAASLIPDRPGGLGQLDIFT